MGLRDHIAAGGRALLGARLRDPALALAAVQALALAGRGLALRMALAAVDARALHAAVLRGDDGGEGGAHGEQGEGGGGRGGPELSAIHVVFSFVGWVL